MMSYWKSQGEHKKEKLNNTELIVTGSAWQHGAQV
jgi:hypothetical protein